MRNLNYESCDRFAPARPGRGKLPFAGRVGIIGAGAPGVSLAVNFLKAGIPITMFEFERIPLDQGIALTRSRCQDAPSGDQRRLLLSGTLNLHHLKDCDLILQVSHDAGADLFQRLGEFARPGAILVTTTLNPRTSYIAGFTRRPDEVTDPLFAAAPGAFDTWQFVCRNGTTAETLDGAIALSRELCMAAGVAAGCHGFEPENTLVAAA